MSLVILVVLLLLVAVFASSRRSRNHNVLGSAKGVIMRVQDVPANASGSRLTTWTKSYQTHPARETVARDLLADHPWGQTTTDEDRRLLLGARCFEALESPLGSPDHIKRIAAAMTSVDKKYLLAQAAVVGGKKALLALRDREPHSDVIVYEDGSKHPLCLTITARAGRVPEAFDNIRGRWLSGIQSVLGTIAAKGAPEVVGVWSFEYAVEEDTPGEPLSTYMRVGCCFVPNPSYPRGHALARSGATMAVFDELLSDAEKAAVKLIQGG